MEVTRQLRLDQRTKFGPGQKCQPADQVTGS